MNDGQAPELDAIARRAAAIRALAGARPLLYFGARHWHWSQDEAISRAVVHAGFNACSTQAGARAAGLADGVGTIPHALVLAFAWRYGPERATVEAARAFDRHIDPTVPRVALVDTFNREIDDALATAAALGDRLQAVRLDTAGENVAQGGVPFDGRPWHTGPGVTIASARRLRQALDQAGYPRVGLVLSSGFGDVDKVRAFVADEQENGRLFDALGIGGLFPARIATADVVRIEGRDLAKTGRQFRHNARLRRIL